MLKGVIFDLDGTLGDTLPVCFAAFRGVFEEFRSVTYSDEEIRAMFGPTEEGILEARLPSDGGLPFERYLALYTAHHEIAPMPFPGIVALLDDLAAHGVPAAVVTGKGARSAAISLDWWGIADRFTSVEAGGARGNIKDRNMRRVLDTWGVSGPAVVSVGDAPSDVHAARAVGITAVAAAWASTAERSLLESEHPDALFTRVADFSAWLRTR
jgi:phosphoglycolate phosphatase-like HAD superfamily hydrolase